MGAPRMPSGPNRPSLVGPKSWSGGRHHPDDALGNRDSATRHASRPLESQPATAGRQIGAGLGGYPTLAASGWYPLAADAPSPSGPAQTSLAGTANPRLPPGGGRAVCHDPGHLLPPGGVVSTFSTGH